jgi:hypothetical protein
LRIQAAFLFFKAKYGCVNNLVGKFRSCHFVCSPTLHSVTILF